MRHLCSCLRSPLVALLAESSRRKLMSFQGRAEVRQDLGTMRLAFDLAFCSRVCDLERYDRNTELELNAGHTRDEAEMEVGDVLRDGEFTVSAERHSI